MADVLEDRDLQGFAAAPPRQRSSFDAAMVRDKMLGMALSSLNSRALVWVATLGGGALWTWAVMNPQPLRLVAATGYAVTILLPILFRDMRDR